MKATVTVQKINYISYGRESSRWDDTDLVATRHTGYEVILEVEGIWRWRTKLNSFSDLSRRSKDQWLSGTSKVLLRENLDAAWPSASKEWSEHRALSTAAEFERSGFLTEIKVCDEETSSMGSKILITWLENAPPQHARRGVENRIRPQATSRNWARCE